MHWPIAPGDLLLLIIAALGIGITKSGFSGVSLVHVLIFAHLFGARDSTGVVLPMLVAGDAFAVWTYGKHADWTYICKLLPAAILGILVGVWMMTWLSESMYRPLIGSIILVLVLLQLVRTWRPHWLERLPNSKVFSWTMGLTAGTTTMLANAAGPVFALYLLAMKIPKLEFVGTAAWFFFIINSFKLPFSWQLGLVNPRTLLINALLIPVIVMGLILGKWLLKKVPQRLFDGIVLALAGLAALRLICG